jgi:transcription elongation factor Elf1
VKKTFRKAIAVILAVLMVAFSVPFSAFAANFGEGTQITANRKWWVDAGVDPSTIKETPTYTGFNELQELVKGDTVYVDGDNADLRNEYKPVIAVTVSKVGTNAEAAEAVSGGTVAAFATKYYNKYYAASGATTYDAVKAAGNIVNPAQLKAGDRIVVTVEFGGFDILCNGQFKGNFDTDAITPAYYAKKPSKSAGDTWKQTDSSTINVNTGEYANTLAFAGKSISGTTGVFTGVILGQNFTNGDTDQSNFFNRDDNTTFGKYGVPSFAYGFEVLKDCDLKDVFHFDRSISGTEFEPYSREGVANYENPELYLITGDDTKNTFANWTEIWSEYEKAEAPSTYTIKFKYANGGEEVSKTVNAGEMPTAPETNTPQTVESDNAGHHTVTTYTWPTVEAATADRVYDEVANPVKSECHYIEKVTVKPTYTTKGEATYTCDVCGHSYTAEIDKLVCDHADTKVVNAKDATLLSKGYTGDTVCNTCGEIVTPGTEIPQLNGTEYYAALEAAQSKNAGDYTAASFAKVTEALKAYSRDVVEAYTSQDDVNTATAALKAAVEGLEANPTTETYTYNFINGESKERTVNKGETPENYPNTPAKVTDNKNGTHTVTTYTWSQDGFVFTEVGSDKVDKCTLNYETVTQPTIKAEGSKEATCPHCGYVSTLPIDKLDSTAYYAALKDAQSKNAKDYTEASYAKVTAALKDYAEDVVATYTDPADVAKATKALQDAVTQLDPGVVVTVASTKLGTTTLNDADATNGANARLAVGDKVVLTAKANNETGEFVGWKVGNKIVSDEATFVTYVTADITYEPVFAEKVDTSFTVVFVDPYGNVIDTQTVNSAEDITVPTEPVFPGYTFTGWSMTEAEIKLLTDGATIYAQYKKDDVAKYTVTANDGATITVNGAEVASPAQVAYDTKVSVHKDGAQAWKLADGTVVGYGDTYTFFCGSDIELTPVMTAVQETTVKILSATPIEGTVKVSFLATRNVAPGETVVKQGFVYGKNLADSELTLENVGNKGAADNAGTVKILYNKNSAEQIALDYGLSKKDGKISAVAFVITKTADGTLKPTMSNIESYTY